MLDHKHLYRYYILVDIIIFYSNATGLRLIYMAKK